MKKLLILALILVGGVAGADSTITSKQYVDTVLDTLQPQVPAKNTDTVLTHTGTAGEIGEKKIYNAGNSYGEQTDALVTAGAFNSAVQNALESEFVCTEWQGDVHDNAHCLLYQVRGATQRQILPDGFTQLEYLESTGTQCIDTGVIPASNQLVYEWEAKDTTPSGSTSLFGSEYAIGGDVNNRDFGGVLHGHQTSRLAFLGRTLRLALGYVSNDDLFHKWSWVINSNHTTYLIKDGAKLQERGWTGSLNRYNTIAIYCNHTTNSFKQQASVAYKYFKIIDSGTVVFFGIPAKRNSDNILGMYDFVSNTFFTNIGTGEFIAGPVGNSNLYLPSGN